MRLEIAERPDRETESPEIRRRKDAWERRAEPLLVELVEYLGMAIEHGADDDKLEGYLRQVRKAVYALQVKGLRLPWVDV